MSKKEQEMNNMLANSAVNFSLLQPTVLPGGAPAQPPPPAAPAVEPKQEADVKPPAAKQEKVDSQAKAPDKKVASKQQKTAKEVSKEETGTTKENPFGYATGPNWPLVSYESPFLLPLPESQARGGAALSIRIPLDLNITVEAHLARLGVKNLSEWLRQAIERQLSLEQASLAKK